MEHKFSQTGCIKEQCAGAEAIPLCVILLPPKSLLNVTGFYSHRIVQNFLREAVCLLEMESISVYL